MRIEVVLLELLHSTSFLDSRLLHFLHRIDKKETMRKRGVVFQVICTSESLLFKYFLMTIKTVISNKYYKKKKKYYKIHIYRLENEMMRYRWDSMVFLWLKT